MKKRILSMMLAIALAVSMLPAVNITAFAADTAAHTHPVCADSQNCTADGSVCSHADATWISWSDMAVDETTFRDGVVLKDVHVYLDDNVTLGEVLDLSAGVTMSLCLNGKTLDVNGRYISVGRDENTPCTFNLCDCADTAGKITGGTTNAALEVYSSTVNMYGGAISGNTNRAVYVDRYGSGYTAAVTILGGSVSDNSTALTTGGGAFYVAAGDLYIGGDAVISGNTAGGASGSSPAPGGAIVINSHAKASVDIGGSAQITGNTATSYGGALYVITTGSGTIGSFTVSGNAQITGNAAEYCGAMFVNSTPLTISDHVRITGNTGRRYYSTTYVYYGAVHYAGQNLRIAGNVVIDDNTHNYVTPGKCNLTVRNSSRIDLTELGPEARLSILCMNNTFPSANTPTVPISTENAAAGAELRVKPDDNRFSIRRSDDGTVQMYVHVHDWSEDWTSDSTAHWHACEAANCEVTDNTKKDGYARHYAPSYDHDNDCTTPIVCETCGYVFVQGNDAHDVYYELDPWQTMVSELCNNCWHAEDAEITAPTGTLKYDGTTAFEATLAYSSGWVGHKPAGITYTRDGEPTTDLTLPGSYQASIQVAEGKTIRVGYTVAMGDGAVTNISDQSHTFGDAVPALTYDSLSQGDVTIEYKRQEADDSCYSTEFPQDLCGTFTVRVTVASDGKYTAASATRDFTISKGETAPVSTTDTVKYFDTTEQTIDLYALVEALRFGDEDLLFTLGAFDHTVIASCTIVDGVLKYTLHEGLPGDQDETTTITVAAAHFTNYLDTTITVTITVEGITHVTVDMSGIALSDQDYDGEAITYTGGASADGYTGGFAYAWYDNAGNKLDSPPVNAGTYILRAAAADEGFEGYGEKEVTISKLDATVWLRSHTITVGDPAPEPALLYSGLLPGEYITPSQEPAFVILDQNGNGASYPAAVNIPGAYTILWANADETTFPDAANYNVTKDTTARLIVEPKYFTLTFDGNGGTDISAVTSVSDTVIDLTDYVPTREGYLFNGWYSDKGLSNEITSLRLTGNTTVYAGWTKIEEPPDPIVNPFQDIFESDWYYGDVMYVYENGLMNGTAPDRFSPAKTATRGMIVTILYRLEGEPSTYGLDDPFTDLTQHWYVDAVKWAAANGIVKGYGDSLYGPDDPITREQMATILWRYATYKGMDVSSGYDMNIAGYADDEQISSYAVRAMKWAIAAGIITGRPGGVLDPTGNAQRCEVAAIIHRFCALTEE